MPKFYVHDICPKMPEFYRIIFGKICPIFLGGGHTLLISYAYVSGPPTSVLVIIIGLMVCHIRNYSEPVVPRQWNFSGAATDYRVRQLDH